MSLDGQRIKRTMLRSTQVSSFLAKISSIRKPASTIQYQSKRNVFFSFEPKELAEENKKNNAWREFENNLEENFSSYEGINDKVVSSIFSLFLRCFSLLYPCKVPYSTITIPSSKEGTCRSSTQQSKSCGLA